MKIWWRWIKLLLTCGLGNHQSIQTTILPGNVTYEECPRCHKASYSKPKMPRPIQLHPPYWDVARGMYDRGIQE